MSFKDSIEINEIIIEEIEELKIPELEKELLYKLLQFEKQNHNTGKQAYQDKYKQLLEEILLKKNKK